MLDQELPLRSVSTPSATTVSLSPWASPMVATTMVPSPGRTPIPLTKDWSTLRIWKGKRLRAARDEVPVPKSSMASLTPRVQLFQHPRRDLRVRAQDAPGHSATRRVRSLRKSRSPSLARRFRSASPPV